MVWNLLAVKSQQNVTSPDREYKIDMSSKSPTELHTSLTEVKECDYACDSRQSLRNKRIEIEKAICLPYAT